MIFCDKENIKIESDIKPCVGARTILPSMDKLQTLDIQLRPFINKRGVTYIVNYKNEEYKIYIEKDYTWDGASIPLGFRWILGGKGNPKFLIPSCVHDKMCECKRLIGCNRKLSSLIFKELLLACGCGKARARIMYLAVDNFQKLKRGWRK